MSTSIVPERFVSYICVQSAVGIVIVGREKAAKKEIELELSDGGQIIMIFSKQYGLQSVHIPFCKDRDNALGVFNIDLWIYMYIYW